MADINEIIDKIRNSNGATGDGASGKEMREWIADGFGLAGSQGDAELFANTDGATPWFVFNTASSSIKVGADLYIATGNKRYDITTALFPNAITFSTSTTSTQALVYTVGTGALQCIPFSSVTSTHLVLFYFNGRAYQLEWPDNFSRKFPYKVDNVLYNTDGAASQGISGTVWSETSNSATVRTVSISGVTSWADVLNKPLFIKTAFEGTAEKSTLNINGLGAKDIYFPSFSGGGLTQTPPVNYWVRAGGVYQVVWNGAVLILLNMQVTSNVIVGDETGISTRVWTETSGSATVRTVTIDGVTSLDSIKEIPLYIRSKAAGTTAITTLDINGLGAKQLWFPSRTGPGNKNSAPYDNWSRSGLVYQVVYNGVNFEVVVMSIPVEA